MPEIDAFRQSESQTGREKDGATGRSVESKSQAERVERANTPSMFLTQ